MSVLLASITELVDRAHFESGVGSFGSNSYREGLDIFLADCSAHGKLTEAGRLKLEAGVVEALKRRLRVEQYAREHPEVTQAGIPSPVVVMGLPRTGTTLLSNLLACDPARRSLLQWEANDPVPPAQHGKLHDDPRVLKVLEVEREMRAANPAAGRFYRSSAVYPTECIHLHSSDFRALLWESHGRLPRYSEYMLGVDMTTAYDYERLVLQVLQSTNPGVWNLKMPSHSLHIRYLLQAFPDARLVWTHRDPYTAMSSLCSLIANTHTWYLTEPDRDWIGRNYPRQIAAHWQRAHEMREKIGGERIYSSHYAETLKDPIGSMRRLYAWLGDEFTPEAEQAMRTWLAQNPQGKFGQHEYNLAEYGLSVENLKSFFQDYMDMYKIESEGRGQ
jgi:hypothetical protein